MKKLDKKRLVVIVGAVKAYTDSTPSVELQNARSQVTSPQCTPAGGAGNGCHVSLVKVPLNTWGIVGRHEIMLQQNMVQLHAYSRI